jgi:hypothetical protein
MTNYARSQRHSGYNMIGGVNVRGIGDIELSKFKQKEQRRNSYDGSDVEDEYDDYEDEAYGEIYFEDEDLLGNETTIGNRSFHLNFDNDSNEKRTLCFIEINWARWITFAFLLVSSFGGLYLWTQDKSNQHKNDVPIQDIIKHNYDELQKNDTFLHNNTYDPFDTNAEQNTNDDFFITTSSKFGTNHSNDKKEAEESLESHEDSNGKDSQSNDTPKKEENRIDGNHNSPLYSKTIISSNFADLTEPYSIQGGDLPIYWHIPKSGGTAIEDILGNCFGLVVAKQEGRHGHESDTDLMLVESEDGITYANVDVSTPDGIKHAQSMGLIDELIVDVAMTSYINEIAEIMKPESNHRGRCFTIIRHPIKRAVSMFYYLQTASWETTYQPEWANMTIEEYAQSNFVENNWMTRMLIQRINGGGPVTPDEFDLAKDILRNKCLIGLLDDLENSLIRFESFFHWNQDKKINKAQIKASKKGGKRDQFLCQKHVVERGGDNAHPHPHYSSDSDVWKELSKHNHYDLQLYDFALKLYDEQIKLIQ